MIYTVYQTTNNVNGKIYIGVHKTKNPMDSYLGSGKVIRLAIKEYGRENFTKEILFEYDNIIDAYLKESEIVNEEFVKRDDTYNLVCGGSISPDKDSINPTKVLRGSDSPNFGKTLSEEHKKKISQKNKGRKRSPEELKKISETMKGRVSPMKGRTLTDEDKRKKSLAALAKPKIECPHCKNSFDPGNYKRFHGDNCNKSPLFSEEKKLARSATNSTKDRKLVVKTCPYCLKQGKGGNMTRYHFDNCKKFTS